MLEKEYFFDSSAEGGDVVEQPWDVGLTDEEIDRAMAELDDSQPTVD